MASVGLPDGVAVSAPGRSGRPGTRQRPDTASTSAPGGPGAGEARGWTGTWRAIWLDWPPLGVPA